VFDATRTAECVPQFANLTYQGEHLAAYAGESVIIRYDPRDITTVFIYQMKESKEVFLTRAHAQGWETETLAYAEAQAISQRKREAGKAISNRSMLEEVRDRGQRVKQAQRQQRQKLDAVLVPPILPPVPTTPADVVPPVLPTTELAVEVEKPKKPVPYVRVMDYEEMKRGAGLL
jgi:putative transposase